MKKLRLTLPFLFMVLMCNAQPSSPEIELIDPEWIIYVDTRSPVVPEVLFYKLSNRSDKDVFADEQCSYVLVKSNNTTEIGLSFSQDSIYNFIKNPKGKNERVFSGTRKLYTDGRTLEFSANYRVHLTDRGLFDIPDTMDCTPFVKKLLQPTGKAKISVDSAVIIPVRLDIPFPIKNLTKDTLVVHGSDFVCWNDNKYIKSFYKEGLTSILPLQTGKLMIEMRELRYYQRFRVYSEVFVITSKSRIQAFEILIINKTPNYQKFKFRNLYE